MKKKGAITIALLLALILGSISATAENILSFMDVALEAYRNEESSMWSQNEVDAIVAILVENGFMISDADRARMDEIARNATLHDKFDVLRILAEAELGSSIFWSAGDRHALQVLTHKHGALDEITDLMPAGSEIGEDVAKAATSKAIADTFAMDVTNADDFIAASVYRSEEMADGYTNVWSFSFTDITTRDVYTARVYSDGKIGVVDKIEALRGLAKYADALINERGPFRLWSAADKAAFSAELPGLIAEAEANGEEIPYDLPVIASYNFSLPQAGELTEEEAVSIAISAATTTYDLEADGQNTTAWARRTLQKTE